MCTYCYENTTTTSVHRKCIVGLGLAQGTETCDCLYRSGASLVVVYWWWAAAGMLVKKLFHKIFWLNFLAEIWKRLKWAVYRNIRFEIKFYRRVGLPTSLDKGQLLWWIVVMNKYQKYRQKGMIKFICLLFVLFCFVLFCFVLFCFVLFCFVLFCFVLFCFLFLFVFVFFRLLKL